MKSPSLVHSHIQSDSRLPSALAPGNDHTDHVIMIVDLELLKQANTAPTISPSPIEPSQTYPRAPNVSVQECDLFPCHLCTSDVPAPPHPMSGQGEE